MFEEIKVRNKTLDLYKLLSRSDFNGSYEDAYTIEQLFTLLCVDLICNSKDYSTKLKSKEMLELAKDIIRVFEIDDGVSNFSVYNWTRAAFEYMKVDNKSYKDIHKMSTIDLRKMLSEYLELSDE